MRNKICNFSETLDVLDLRIFHDAKISPQIGDPQIGG